MKKLIFAAVLAAIGSSMMAAGAEAQRPGPYHWSPRLKAEAYSRYWSQEYHKFYDPWSRVREIEPRGVKPRGPRFPGINDRFSVRPKELRPHRWRSQRGRFHRSRSYRRGGFRMRGFGRRR